MRHLRAWWQRMRGFFGERAGEDFSAELEGHLQMHIEDNLRAGMSAEEARRAALIKSGGLEQARQAYRDRESLPWLENLWQDLRFAFRQLRKSPGFTLTAVLTLALGIGALTTVATWTNAVLYNPWPHVNAPRELRFIDATVLGNDGYSVHYDNYQFLRDSGRSWKHAIAFSQGQVNLTQRGTQAQAITAGVVSSNYFQFLGLAPQSRSEEHTSELQSRP